MLYGLAYSVLLWGIVAGILPLSIGFGLMVGLPWVARILIRIYKASGPKSALLILLKQDALRLHFWLGALVCLALLVSK